MTLAPGAFSDYATSYTLTQADLDKAGNAGIDGDIDNTATADSNETGEVDDSAEVPLVYNPAIAIDKVFVNVTGGDGDALPDAVGDVLLDACIHELEDRVADADLGVGGARVFEGVRECFLDDSVRGQFKPG